MNSSTKHQASSNDNRRAHKNPVSLKGTGFFSDKSDLPIICQNCSVSREEKEELVTNCDRFEALKHSSVMPRAFTEQDVAMFTRLNPKAV